MPHGLPDWGLVGPKETTYGLNDLGEAVVRLGSPHLWDRRGDVVSTTEFSPGLGIWQVSYWAPPAYGTLFTERSRSGAFCVKLVTGGVAAQETGLVARIPMPRTAGLALEFSFSTRSTQLFWGWSLTWRIGVDQYMAIVRWDLVNSLLQYWGADGAYHVFATSVSWLDLDRILNTGKMVVASQTWQYARFLLNDQTYSLAGIPVEHRVMPPAHYFIASLALWGAAAINAVGYVDNVIVTQNEP